MLALLARAIYADISVDAVARLIVVDLSAQAVLLLAHVVLVGGPTHVVANEIAAVVYQLLLPLLLAAVDAGTLAHVLTCSILA